MLKIIKQKTHETVQDYYGRILKSTKDLKTNACCLAEAMPPYLREALQKIHPEVKEKFYGCGSPIPQVLQGKTVLDLGCGTGRDCYLLSQLVGSEGRVIGVDMTKEQLEVGQKHLDYHMKEFGFSKPNVEFHQGFIEDLESIGIQNNSVDVVVSNCVINLSPEKERVFSEIFSVLKPGGELYFSDVFADRRIPDSLREDSVLVGECLGGALYIEDFRRLLEKIGCPDYRIVSQTPLTLDDPEVQSKVGSIQFYSITVRAFKLELEDRCENYGHVAYYKGSIAESPHEFVLDNHHVFEMDLPFPVCGNTACILTQTRYGEHFRVEGDFSTHYGAFECGVVVDSKSGGCC